MKYILSGFFFFAMLFMLQSSSDGQDRSTMFNPDKSSGRMDQGLKSEPARANSVTTTSLPLKMSYQGLLTIGGNPVTDGSYDLTVGLFDSLTNGSLQWSEVHPGVAVQHGTFSITLGITAPLNLRFNKPLFVQLTVTSGPAGPTYPMTFSPRSELLSAPYSLAPWVTNGNDIYYTGKVGIGSTAPESSGIGTLRMEIADENGLNSDLAMRVASNASPVIHMVSSGGTLKTPTSSHLGDILGWYLFDGHDGSEYRGSAGILGIVDDVPSQGSMPGRLSFYTGGSIDGFKERLRLDRNGNLDIDPISANTGAVTPGLVFGGPPSGEGIASNREWWLPPPVNALGLDFYTNFLPRLAITNGGNVGIGTSSPANNLSVIGNADFSGNVGIGTSSPANNLSVIGNADFSGNVGIGTSTPTNKLSVSGNANVTGNASVTGNANISGNVGIGTATPGARLQAIGDVFVGSMSAPDFGPDGSNLFVSNTSGDSHNSFRLDGYSNGLYIVAHSSLGAATGTGMYFCTSTAQGGEPTRMYINPTGSVGIGTTTPAYKLEVNGDINALGSVRSNGTALTSDIRFKKDIVSITNAIDRVKVLRGVTYFWKQHEFPEKKFSDKKQIGFIAQELEEVFPELVSTGADGYKGIDYARLTPVLVEAIKSLDDRNEKLNARLSELEAAVKSLVAQRPNVGDKSIGLLK